ncbi:MFS general substrate transporter [Delitschia confertaspora ATCC 74209]|uniref:MFS general substrate transporter n=1 Tax=Delitschia confertaspora ATCC 74209 TaxID=1513339 RepID=A0A9P4JFG6_9PLEO|nr:MFS general substrate transporter [Delitschia confertaspora ATCC 74209]
MSADPSTAERTPLLQRRSLSPASSSISKSAGSFHSGESNLKDEEGSYISPSRGVVIAVSIGVLIFLQAINISIMTTTQSSIAADLDAFDKTTWLQSSYLIAMSSLAPLMGRLSQLFSPRLCMFCSTLAVVIGTIITSLSVSFEMFMVGRVITGAGAGGILIVATIIVIQIAGPKRRGLHIGLVNAGMTAGVSLGAVIGGAFEPKIGWKVLFGIQVPIALLAGFGLLLSIPAKYEAGASKNSNLSLRQKISTIDYSGALLLISTIVLFLLGLSGHRILATPIVLSALTLPIFVLNEIYVAMDPIIPITVLKSRGTLLTCLATVGFMMARYCILFYTPVYAMAVRDWKPAVAGSILIPTNAGFASGGLLAGIFHIRRDGSFYLPSVISMGLFPLTFLLLEFISTPDSSWTLYVLSVFINGLLTGASLNYTLVHLLHLTPSSVHPIALSLLATFRGFAGSFGAAIGGGFFERVLRKSLVEGFKNAGHEGSKDLIRRLMGSPQLVGQLEGKEKEIAVHAYQSGIKALFLGAMALGIIVVFIQAGTGWKEAVDHEATQEPEEADQD